MEIDRLREVVVKLMQAINRADFDDEIKKLSALEKLLIEIDSGTQSIDENIEKLKHLVHHYERMIDLQMIEPEIKDVQEFIDKNG